MGLEWHHATSTSVSPSARLRLFLSSHLSTLAQSEKVFQIISTAVRERQSKCWRGGKKRFWDRGQDKMTCSSRYVLQRVLWVGPNSPWCSTITKSSKGWIITWLLNFLQLSFSRLCSEQMLHEESFKKNLCYLNPFQVCKMRNICSRINTSIQTKADLFKSVSPAREEDRFDSPLSVWGVDGKGYSHLRAAFGPQPIHGRIRIWPFPSHFVSHWKSYLIHLLVPRVSKVIWKSSSRELAFLFFMLGSH